jgi:hypothetical protein
MSHIMCFGSTSVYEDCTSIGKWVPRGRTVVVGKEYKLLRVRFIEAVARRLFKESLTLCWNRVGWKTILFLLCRTSVSKPAIPLASRGGVSWLPFRDGGKLSCNTVFTAGGVSMPSKELRPGHLP